MENTIESSSKCLHEGHSISFTFQYPSGSVCNSYNCNHSLIVHCKVSPTHWTMTVAFTQETVNSNVDVSVFITRKDETPTSLHAFFWMRAYPDAPLEGGRPPIVHPQKFDLEDVQPHVQVNQIFKDYLPIHILRAQAGRPLDFETYLAVRGCHRGLEE